MPSKLDIDAKQVQKLAARFWNNCEIAAFFGCDEATIRKRFSESVAKGRELGRGKLRDAQLKKAFDGNPALLIWLGKQYLGQTEKIEVSQEEFINEELEFVDMPKGKINGKFNRFYN